MGSEPRTIKGPCFDCGQQCLSWCLADDPPQPESDDTAPIPKLTRALGKHSVLMLHRQIREIREFFGIPETEPEPKYDDTAERDYIAYCDGLSGGSEKYTTGHCSQTAKGIDHSDHRRVGGEIGRTLDSQG